MRRAGASPTVPAMPLRIGKRKIALVSQQSGVEETTSPLIADDRNFYKVEVWSLDGQHVDRLLYAGNSLDKARVVFATFTKKRPRVRVTVGQRERVLFRSQAQGQDSE